MEQNFLICRDLSRYVYNDYMPLDVCGWKILSPKEYSIEHFKDINVLKVANFACAVYKKDNEIIISYRGTDGIVDLITDANFVAKKVPVSTDIAVKVYKKICELFPDSKIWVTGHSLGGAYAQIVATKAIKAGTECRAITFNAPGFGYLLSDKDKMKFRTQMLEYINNYVIMNDFVGNFREHVGSTYYIQPYPLNVKNPEKPEEMITPHSAITSYDEKINGKIISCPEGWNSKCAWALWIYDENPVSKSQHDLQRILEAKTNYDSLVSAIDIIEKLKQEEDFVLLNTFKYRCIGQEFILKSNSLVTV